MKTRKEQLQYALYKIVGTNKGVYRLNMYSALMYFFDTSPSCLMSVDKRGIIVHPKDREELIHELELAIKYKEMQVENEPNITRPPHYENEGKAQIWDYFHFLDGIQSNVLKYLDIAGKKQGATFNQDISKAIAYANKGASLGELQKGAYCPFRLLAKITGNIDTFKDVKFAIVASAVLHGNYKFAVKMMEEWT